MQKKDVPGRGAGCSENGVEQLQALLSRLAEDRRIVAALGSEGAGREALATMYAVVSELERAAEPLLRAMRTCETMIQSPVFRRDPNLLRNAQHLGARIDAVALQLEDTTQTLERLVGHAARAAVPPETVRTLSERMPAIPRVRMPRFELVG